MNILRKIFKKVNAPAIIDPLMGKTVIHFTTHGCMGQINEFDYIGTIVGIKYPEGKFFSDPYSKFYIVKILKDRCGELRDNWVQNYTASVPSWYLQDLGGDFLIAYD